MKKIKEAIGSVIGGIICIIGGVCLLWWNEGDAVKNIKTVEEARANLVNVKSDEVNSDNEGKLVSTNGKIKVIDESLKDDYFNVIVPGTGKLVRVVEMYQWEEECEEDDDVTHCTYTKKWSESEIDSSSFEESGHENPSDMPYEEEAYYANQVELGAFKLSSTQITMLSTNAVVTPDATVFLPNGYTVIDKYITSATSMSSPKVGDVRVSFKYNNDTDITVLAMQKGDSFANYVSEKNKIINELHSGILSGEEMIDIVETENNIFKWILRVIGVLLVTAGFAALLTPILMVISIIPLVGDGIAGILRFIAGLVGFAFSMLVIALAWVFYRPLIGICLLAVVVGVIALIVVLIKKGRAKANAAQAAGQSVDPNQQLEAQQPMMGQSLMQQQVQPVVPQQPVVQQPVQSVQPVQQPVMQQPIQPVAPQQPVNPLEQQQLQAAQQAAQEQIAAQQAAQQPQQSQDPLSIFGQNNNQ